MNNLPEKLKSTLYICCLERSTKIKIEIIFGKENFSIYFIEPLKPEYIKEIREIFLPFISDDNSQIKINYIYIKNIYEDSSRLLKFTLHNPLSLSIFTIIFNRLKYKKSIIFWEKDLPPLLLPSISLNINQKIMAIAERKINDIISIIILFYQFIGIERNYNKKIEEFFSKAFLFGKKYFEKNNKDFDANQKINKKLMKEENTIQLNNIINDIKIKKESNIMEQIKKAQKSSSDIEDDEDEKEKSNNEKMDINKILVNNGTENNDYNASIFFALDMDSNNKRDLFQNYDKFKKYQPEIRIKTSYFTEITINIIYKMLNVDKNDLYGKFNFMNKTEMGYRININTNSKYKMPIFGGLDISWKLKNPINDDKIKDKKNSLNFNDSDNNDYNNNKNEINENELFDFFKNFNSFLPNNSLLNIIDNTSQIIHRKFFELLFKNYFSDIINIESNKNKTIDFDTFILIFKIIRRLKQILFTEKNIIFFSDYLFLKE